MLLVLNIFISFAFFAGCFCDDVDEDFEKKHNHTSCEKLYSHFTAASEMFSRCVLQHNAQATFCLDCVGNYSKVTYILNEFMNGYDFIEPTQTPGPSCRSQYVDINQLNLVEDTYANVQRFWNAGSCSDCYTPHCNFTNYFEDPNSCSVTNQTEEFRQLHKETVDCINQYDPKNALQACTNCSSLYGKLNEMYDHIRVKTSNQFCFVIKDWMNKTQFLWANETGCCSNRQPIETDFYVVSSFSIAISIGFYIATFIVGKRNERIQPIPDDLMPPNHDRSGGVTMNIEANPTTSDVLNDIDSNRRNHQKLSNASNHDSNSDDSDGDEEILPVHNPNLIQI